MASNQLAPIEEAGLARVPEEGSTAGEPADRPVGQNVAVALLPLAIIGLLLISFVAAAWTFLAALPPA
jgi:hypothetical protein